MFDWGTAALIASALGVGSVIGILVRAWIDKPKRAAELKKALAEGDHAEGLNQAQIADLFASTAGKLVEAQNIQINELQQEFANYKAETKAENAALICEIGRLEGKIEALETDNAQKNDEAETMQEEIRTLRRKIEDKDRKIEHLEAENVQLRDRVSELERKLEKLVSTDEEAGG